MHASRCNRVRKIGGVVVACLVTLTLGVASGQQQKMAAPPGGKAPQITNVFPAGARRGESAEIEVRGKNLVGVTALYCSTPGVTVEKLEAKSDKGNDLLNATLAIAKDAAAGTIELRAVSGEGISNLKLFRIDELPELKEAAGRHVDAAHAQKIEFPAVVNGQLAQAEADCYQIHVAEPGRVVFEVEARRLGSPANARLRLLDSCGREIAAADTTRSIRPDERIDYDFKQPGDYVIEVGDTEYVGGEGAVYRLRIGSLPYATTLFPLGGRRGETIEVTLAGGNLSKPLVEKVKLPDDPFVTAVPMQFNSEFGTLAAPMLLGVADETEIFEQEQNDDPKEPQKIDVPVTVNGRIDKPGDKDRFRITVKKGEKFNIEVFADRLGSWLDSVLVVADKNGRTVVENDDAGANPNQRPQQQQNQPIRRTISDSKLEFTAPADGDYTITVDDRYNAGGPEFAYRLSITPSRPDFALAYGQAPQQGKAAPQPKNAAPPTPPDVVNLEPGKTATVPITVDRRGFDGKIELTVRGLPDGVTAEPATIAEKQPGGQITVKAAGDAAAVVTGIQIIGAATIDNQEVRRLVRTDILLAQIDNTHLARRELSDFALVVPHRELPLTMKANADALLPRGLETELKVVIDRKAGFKGPVEIKADKLPKGVTAAKATIAADATEGTIKLSSKADSALGNQRIQLTAQGKLNGANVESSAEVALAVVAPFELALDTKEKELDLTIGESCAVKLTIKRQGKFDGPIELAVAGLPAGVTATPHEIEPDQDEIEITLSAGADAKPTKAKKPIKIQATGSIGKQKIKVETAAIELQVKAAE